MIVGGTSRIVIDRAPANIQAIRAYRRAGFHVIGKRDTSADAVLVMALDANSETDDR